MEALKLEEAKWLFQDRTEAGIDEIRILSEVLLWPLSLSNVFIMLIWDFSAVYIKLCSNNTI